MRVIVSRTSAHRTNRRRVSRRDFQRQTVAYYARILVIVLAFSTSNSALENTIKLEAFYALR